MKRAAVLSSLILAGLTFQTVTAQERPIHGARSLAMGGTSVASRDSSAAYGNPAAFVFEPLWDLTVPLFVVNAEVEGDILETSDAIHTDFESSSLSKTQKALNDGSVSQRQRADALDAFLYQIPRFEDPGQGVAARFTAGPAFRYKHWGVSVSAIAYGGVSPVVDLSTGLSLGTGGFANAIPDTPNDCGGDAACQIFAATLVADSGGQLTPEQAEQLVFDGGIAQLQKDARARSILRDMVRQTAAGGTTLEENQSGAITRGILIEQVAFTYSHRILTDRLGAGVTLKYLRGETVQDTLTAGELDTGDDLLHDVTNRENRKVTSTVGVDVGILYKPITSLRLGLAGSNLNAPEFDFARGGGAFKLDPVATAGVAWSFKRWLTLAGDLDLNEIDSGVVDGFKYRYGRVGAEFLVWKFLALQGGAYRNLAADNGAPVYTGGVGFRIGSFEIALSGAISNDEVATESSSSGGNVSTVPAGAGFGIAFNWKPGR